MYVANPNQDPNSTAIEALNPNDIAILANPSADHWFGTDNGDLGALAQIP